MAAQLTYWVLPVGNQDKARAFYGAVMGWEFSDPGSAGGAHVLDSEPWGGLGPNDRTSTATLAFGVDDIAAAVARIRELGGTADDPADSGGYGLWSECTDDQGTRFALFTRAG